VRYVVYRLAVAKVEIRGEGSPFSAWACSHDGRAHQMLMGVNIFDATVAFLFLNMYVRLTNDQITVNTTVSQKTFTSFPSIFTNFKVQERYLPIIRGAF